MSRRPLIDEHRRKRVPQIEENVKDLQLATRTAVVEAVAVTTTSNGAHPDLATHDTLGLATDAELATHAAGPHGGGSALTVQEVDGAPIDVAVTIIRVPNGSLTDNGVGDVTLDVATDAELATHAALATHHAALTIGADVQHSLAGQVLSGVDATTAQKGHAKFDTTIPASIGTAAAGASAVIADRAHVHATGAGTPSTQAFADAAAVGTGPAASMTDHKHAMPANPVTAHAADADPHTGYQKESEKGAASGYASLDAGTLVPVAQLGSGAPDGTKFLRDDQTYAVPAGGAAADLAESWFWMGT